MTTEIIDIVVRENGSRVVKRNLEAISDAAHSGVRNLRFLQNSLFVLGGAGILRGLVGVLDALTNMDNRIKLVTTSSAQLRAVQYELFSIASKTRTAYESTAQIYARTALSVRELGLSQREVLQFTETLNKAVILGGGEPRETHAAVIQLSQALAAGRLNGDELRSVMEQLPLVADVISQHLGVTRGQLKEMGRDGRISSQQIVESFAAARSELDAKFGRTLPTVSQALTVLQTSFLKVLYSFNEFFLVTSAIAGPILLVANHLHELVAGAVAATAAFAAFRAVKIVDTMLQAAQASKELSIAVAAGNATLLTGVDIEYARANANLASAKAQAVSSAATVKDIQIGLAQLQQDRAWLIQQQASIVMDHRKLTARSALTGQFVSYEAAMAQNLRTTLALQAIEQRLVVTKAELSAATISQTAATNTLSGAQARVAAAGIASNTWTARLSRAFPGLAGGIGTLRGAFTALGASMAANPWAWVVAAIVAAGTALAFFSNDIKVTEDKVVSLRDFTVAGFQLMGEQIKSVADQISETFKPAFEKIAAGAGVLWAALVGGLTEVGLGFVQLTDLIIGIFVGTWNAVTGVWNLLPDAFRDIFILTWNGVIRATENFINIMIDAMRLLLSHLQDPFRNLGRITDAVFTYIVARIRNFGSDFVRILNESFTRMMQNFTTAINFIARGLNLFATTKVDLLVTPRLNPETSRGGSGSLDLSRFITTNGRVDLSSLEGKQSGALRRAGEIAGREFMEGVTGNYVGPMVDNMLKAIEARARQNIAKRGSEDLDKTSAARRAVAAEAGKHRKPRREREDTHKSFQDILDELNRENALLRVNSAEREKLQAIHAIEEQMGRKLRSGETSQVRTLLDLNEVLTESARIYDELKDPAYDYALTLRAINGLLNEQKISQDEATRSLREARITFLDTQNDMASGAERALLKLRTTYADEASQIETVVTNMFKGLEDAIFEFTKSGKLNLKDFFKQLYEDVARFNIRKYILAPLAGKLGISGTVLGIPLGSTRSTPMWIRNADAGLGNLLGTEGSGVSPQGTPQTLGGKILAWWETLKTAFKSGFSGLLDLFKALTGNLGGVFKNLILVLGNVIKSILHMGSGTSGGGLLSSIVSIASSFFGGSSLSSASSFGSSTLSSFGSSFSTNAISAGVSNLVPAMVAASSSTSSAPNSANQTLNYYIDARGSQDPEAVRQTVADVLDERTPSLLSHARQQSQRDTMSILTRQQL